jgi:hypothetical protein
VGFRRGDLTLEAPWLLLGTFLFDLGNRMCRKPEQIRPFLKSEIPIKSNSVPLFGQPNLGNRFYKILNVFNGAARFSQNNKAFWSLFGLKTEP